MADGTVWTVGTRGYGSTFAWQPPHQTDDGSDDACPPLRPLVLRPDRMHAADGGGR